MPKTAPALLCLFLLAFPCGCGRKTMVVPPDTVRPAAVSGLVASQDETGIHLIWNRPRKNATGGDLDQPANHFEIQRGQAPINDFCPGCPAEFHPIATVNLPGPARPVFNDHDLDPGQVYSYRVIAINGIFGRALPSATVNAAWGILPPKPAPPVARAGDGVVHLSWSGNPGYAWKLEKITAAATTVLSHGRAGEKMENSSDHEVKNGIKYGYRLRLVRRIKHGLRLEGPASKTVIAVPRDLTPPPVVTGVKALWTKEGVTVFWEPVISADLGGYRIRRRENGRSMLLGTAGAQMNSFIDHNPPPGLSWQYRVSAIDNASPANESAPSAAASIRRTR